MKYSSCRLPAIALLTLVLAACGSGTDSSGSGGASISGSVVKGITANAVITITAPDGTLLATTESDAQGAFAATLPAGFNGAVQIVATASVPPDAPTTMRCDAPSGCIDANSNTVLYGNWFNVPADFRMSAVAAVDGAGIHLVNLTPLSTMAANWALRFPQGLDADAANTANAEVAAMFGLALTDLQKPAGDITNPLWTQLADTQQLQLALLYATFAEVAKQYGVTEQNVVDVFSGAFANQQGSLLQASSGPDASVGFLTGIATTVAGTIDMPGSSYNDVQTAFSTLAASLTNGQMTSTKPVSYADFLGKLGPLGKQIDQVLNITGLDNPKQFIVDKTPYFAWLLSPDNVQIAPLGINTVLYSLLGSLELDLLPPGTTSVVLFNGVMPATSPLGTPTTTVTLDVPSKTLTIVGAPYGQQANITIGLTGFLSGAAAEKFNYSVDGTVANPTASGEIHGTLAIDTGSTDFQPLLDAFAALKLGSPTASTQLQAAIQGLAYSLTANVTLAGNAQLVNNANPSLVLSGQGALTATLNLGAQTGQDIATLDVSSVDLLLPDGSHLTGLPGTSVVTAAINDNATLAVNGTGTILGLPQAFLHAQGQLTNARLLFNYVRDTLVNAVTVGPFDIPTIISQIQAFDYTQLALSGQGTITIPSLGHEYRASLDNLTATFYQPNSTDVAATATLVVADQKVHFLIGTEPWDLRLMMTPTPRLVLIGPQGQFAEATQEDVFALLNDLPGGSLLDKLLP